MPDQPVRITELLEAWGGGNAAALDQLVPLIQAELIHLARRYVGREAGHRTLQVTALVNEAYLRLLQIKQVEWQDRAHFFAVAARVMRRILVDSARARRAQKRAQGVAPIPLDEALVVSANPAPDVLALEEALVKLEAIDARRARVVELRFFTGLSVAETASVLGVSTETIKRDWRLAKAWLSTELGAVE